MTIMIVPHVVGVALFLSSDGERRGGGRERERGGGEELGFPPCHYAGAMNNSSRGRRRVPSVLLEGDFVACVEIGISSRERCGAHEALLLLFPRARAKSHQSRAIWLA